MKGNRNFEKQH